MFAGDFKLTVDGANTGPAGRRPVWNAPMLHASTQNLIRKLCDITEHGEAPWTEGQDGAFWFDTEGYRIEVKANPPTLRILQAGGREVEAADAGALASTPFPEEPGVTFADRVQRMGNNARRVARGADAAISTILSALSNPPRSEPAHFSTEGGAESEAAMAAAVADMAERLKQPPTEPAPLQTLGEAAAKSTPVSEPPASAPPLRTIHTHAMFGATPSFVVQTSVSTETPAQPARPSAQKVASSGLVISSLHAVTIQTPEMHSPADIKQAPSASAYRPWS